MYNGRQRNLFKLNCHFPG